MLLLFPLSYVLYLSCTLLLCCYCYSLSRVSLCSTMPSLSYTLLQELMCCLCSSTLLYFRLDPALVRPGRVDLKVEIGHATKFQVEQLHQRFYPEVSLEKSRRFAQLVLDKGRKVSMAQIQGYFLLHKSDPDVVMRNIDTIWH